MKINPFQGSVRASLTLASYLGFSHAYLVGFDYTHNPARSLHWYEKGEGTVTPHIGYEEDFFKIAKEFIDITTVSLNGKTGVKNLNSISYKDLTGKDFYYKSSLNIMILITLTLNRLNKRGKLHLQHKVNQMLRGVILGKNLVAWLSSSWQFY